MVHEAAVDVVVLAVDIGRNRPTDGYLASAGRYGNKVASRDGFAKQFIEAHPCAKADDAGFWIDGGSLHQTSVIDDGAACTLGRVTVASTQASSDEVIA